MAERLYRIGDAADLLGLKTYVLRYWETEFPQIRPVRTGKGQRRYTEKDMATLGRIRYLLHDQGMTIEGARRVLIGASALHLAEEPPFGIGGETAGESVTEAVADIEQNVGQDVGRSVAPADVPPCPPPCPKAEVEPAPFVESASCSDVPETPNIVDVTLPAGGRSKASGQGKATARLVQLPLDACLAPLLDRERSGASSDVHSGPASVASAPHPAKPEAHETGAEAESGVSGQLDIRRIADELRALRQLLRQD